MSVPATATRQRQPAISTVRPTPHRSWLVRWTSSVPGSASGFGEALEAASTDVTSAIDLRHRPAGDPLELRDPKYIRRTLPGLRALSELYFRAEVRGMSNVPAGPVLLVGNHSGGWLIADTFVFAQSFYDYFGPERMFHQLTHDLVFKVPGLRAIIAPYGVVPACPENMRRALARDAALLVYPGGDHETYRASWHSADIDFGHRTGLSGLLSSSTSRSSRLSQSVARKRPSSSAGASTSHGCCTFTSCCGSTSRRSRSDHPWASRSSTSRSACRCRRRLRSTSSRRFTCSTNSGQTPTPSRPTNSSPGVCRRRLTAWPPPGGSR
jgi:hypothetical protein